MATALGNLAFLYHDLGKYAEAESLFERAVAIDEKALDPDPPRRGHEPQQPGGVYRDLGKYAEAEPLYKRSLAIREKVLGPTTSTWPTSLNARQSSIDPRQVRRGRAAVQALTRLGKRSWDLTTLTWHPP